MKSVLFGILVFMMHGSRGQERVISGSVINSKEQPVQAVTITARYPDSSKILAFAISGSDGIFRIRNIPPSLDRLILEFRHISYEQKTMLVENVGEMMSRDLNIRLTDKITEMKEVLIKRDVPILIRSDTVVFNANSYRDTEVKKVEDLLKKMQGFSVDPNGRLSFNGKPVEKVLIDGDDLADKDYQLITRNLDALKVDKVEVINNYSDNRLMRGISESNKVGVNLRISSKLESKISGGIEAGLSAEQRYNADFNVVHLEKRQKWLLFGNYNNTARDPSGSARHSFQQEGGRLSDAENTQLGSWILEPGSFSIPALGEKYTRDNSDLGVALMNSWRLSDYVRINGLVGYEDLSNTNRARSLVLTEISDLENWLISNDLNIHKRANDLAARISLQRDKGKKHVTRFDLSVNGGKQNSRFSNLTSGAISDSLKEKLVNHLKQIRLSWQETFLLGRKVLQLHFNFDHGRYNQEMGIRSTRYLSYWAVDSSYIFNEQALNSDRDHYQFLLRINGKSSRIQYEYGIRFEYRVQKYLSDANVRSSAPKPDLDLGSFNVDTRDMICKGMFRVGLSTSRKGWWGIFGETGWEMLETRSEETGFINFNAGIGYSKSFSLLNSFRINYKLGSGFKEYDKLYPDELISGDGVILNGMNFKGPEFSHGFVASLNSNNIRKQSTWSANLSYMMMPLRYTGSLYAYPEYSLQYFDLSRHNNLLNAGVNWEGYIRAIRGKLGGLFRLSSGSYENIVNQVKGSSQRSGLQLEGWWVSGFQMPVNAELKAGASYAAGRWDDEELNRNWQYHWSGKLKIKTGKSFYGAMVWNVHKLASQSIFHAWDIFASYKLSGSWLLTLTGTNLTNTGRVLDKMVMPYSKSESSFSVVGRYLLVSMNWNF